jgi:hypothetical protein
LPLRNKKETLNDQFSLACANYAKHPESADTYQEMLRISEERTRVFDSFHEMESNIFKLYKELNNGSIDKTWYELEAEKQVELGDYKAAVAILQDEQRKKELEQAVLFADISLERIKAHIRENELLIKTLKAQKRTAATVSEIEQCYKESAELTLKYHLDNRVVYDYVVFLVVMMDDFEKTIELTDILKEQIKNDDTKALADIYRLMGQAYLENAKQPTDGRNYYIKALELYYQLEDSYLKYHNIVISTLGIINACYMTKDYEVAYDLMKKLQEIYETKQLYLNNHIRVRMLNAFSFFFNARLSINLLHWQKNMLR